jgi:hypothetical protein
MDMLGFGNTPSADTHPKVDSPESSKEAALPSPKGDKVIEDSASPFDFSP